jgi:ribosomal protein S27AE
MGRTFGGEFHTRRPALRSADARRGIGARVVCVRHTFGNDGTQPADHHRMDEQRTCPNCGEPVADTDTVCPHCGETLVGG